MRSKSEGRKSARGVRAFPARSDAVGSGGRSAPATVWKAPFCWPDGESSVALQLHKRKGGRKLLREVGTRCGCRGCGPEKASRTGDLRQHFGEFDAARLTMISSSRRFLPQAVVDRQPVGEDGIVRNRSLGQPVGQNLLPRRQRLEARRVQLNECRVSGNARRLSCTGFFLLAKRWRSGESCGIRMSKSEKKNAG